MRDGQDGGTPTGASAHTGYASRRHPRPVGVGGTVGLDGSHVGGAGTRRERRQPNAFFAAGGLFSLPATYQAVCQPPLG